MADTIKPTVIAPTGDLVLEIRETETSGAFAYRVDSKTLKRHSRYFENLLSDRFNEGQQLSAALEALKAAGHSNIADAPEGILPRIPIVNVGRISKVSSIQPLVSDFLRSIHGQDLGAVSPPIANLANLAVLADRFDALPYFSRFTQRKKYLLGIDAKSKQRSTTLPEERVRQKLLIGLLFDHPPWVTRYSKFLIMRDSKQWAPGTTSDGSLALWWDMPNGVEDELIQRRECILETINSLQAHFLKLYTSGERQCKLGYDSSSQCDSFQLGEMIRFFTRLSTLRLQGTIYDNSEPTYYSGDIGRLLDSFRQCSSYQIDRNHSHCGLRTRLLPLVDMIQNHLSLEATSLDIGICSECWKNHREAYAWSSAKRPMLWGPAKDRNFGPPDRSQLDSMTDIRRNLSSCLGRHLVIRDIFMATERIWTA